MVKGCCALSVMKLLWPWSNQQTLRRWMTMAVCVWRAAAFALIVWPLSNNYLIFCYKAWWSSIEFSLFIQEVSACHYFAPVFWETSITFALKKVTNTEETEEPLRGCLILQCTAVTSSSRNSLPKNNSVIWGQIFSCYSSHLNV